MNLCSELKRAIFAYEAKFVKEADNILRKDTYVSLEGECKNVNNES